MKWISFFQTPYDRVRFITSELPEYSSLTYKNFLNYLFETFHMKDKTGIVEQLDKFQTILLDINTGEFIVIKPPKGEAPTFDELWELNKEDEKKTNKLDVQVERAKGLIDQLWAKKKKDKK